MDRSMQDRFRSCFNEWVKQQEADLDELMEALPITSYSRKDEQQHSSSSSSSSRRGFDEGQLRLLVEKALRHFEEYAEKRRAMAKEYAPTFFSPVWCSSFENSFLWMGGCRPTMAIRLVYTLSSSDLEDRLDEIFGEFDLCGSGSASGSGGLLVLTARQLNLINELHCRMLKEEERLSGRLASLQEDVADDPLLPFVKNHQMERRGKRIDGVFEDGGESSNRAGGSDSNEVAAVMDRYAEAQAKLLDDADKLRVQTMRELAMQILTPLQAAELLACGKQLHLSVHDWSQKREEQRVGGGGGAAGCVFERDWSTDKSDKTSVLDNPSVI